MRDAVASVPLAGAEEEGGAEAAAEATSAHMFPADSIALLEGRAAVHELLSMDAFVDLIIPRGSVCLFLGRLKR
jgi:gamma-glutamyl phosphate reductase